MKPLILDIAAGPKSSANAIVWIIAAVLVIAAVWLIAKAVKHKKAPVPSLGTAPEEKKSDK